MSTENTVEFQCGCGQSFRALRSQGGKAYFCPVCGKKVAVPTGSAAMPVPISKAKSGAPSPISPVPPVTPSLEASLFGVKFTVPSTFQSLLGWLFSAWAGLSLALLILSQFSKWLWPVCLILIAVLSVSVAQQAWRLVRARATVLGQKDVSLLWGMVRLIAWDPTEGVLILRDKAVCFADDDLYDGRGGIRFVYPILGEELALRVPLEVQSLHFVDENVLTREYLTLTIRVTIKWRIVDVRKFYLLVSRELRYTNDRRDGSSNPPPLPQPQSAARGEAQPIGNLIDAAIEWLRWVSEQQTRAVVSRVSSGLLIADQVAADLPVLHGDGSGTSTRQAASRAANDFSGATDGLAAAINDTITEKVQDYGFMIHEVSLQEIKLPPEVYKQCVEAAKAAYLPLLAQREASRHRAELQAEVELLGREAVGTREIVSNAPAYALGDFLNQYLAKHGPTSGPTAGVLAAALTSSATQAALPSKESATKPNDANS